MFFAREGQAEHRPGKGAIVAAASAQVYGDGAEAAIGIELVALLVKVVAGGRPQITIKILGAG